MDYIIIVAGGKGLRMGTEVPKQFLPIGGRPVILRTIDRFKAYDPQINVILVLPHEQHGCWQQLCRQHGFHTPCTVVEGGETRFHSVKNGLQAVPDTAQGMVGVHDGVRPFAAVEVIRRCFSTARTAQAVIPVVPVVETLRHLLPADATGQHPQKNAPFGAVPSETVARADYRLVQTPQVFSIQLLKQAYAQPYCTAFTDDASVVEAMGHEVTLVEGNRENIKLTTPFDLTVAEALIQAGW